MFVVKNIFHISYIDIVELCFRQPNPNLTNNNGNNVEIYTPYFRLVSIYAASVNITLNAHHYVWRSRRVRVAKYTRELVLVSVQRFRPIPQPPAKYTLLIESHTRAHA